MASIVSEAYASIPAPDLATSLLLRVTKFCYCSLAPHLGCRVNSEGAAEQAYAPVAAQKRVTTSQISLLALVLVGDIGLLLIAVSILLYALIQR